VLGAMSRGGSTNATIPGAAVMELSATEAGAGAAVAKRHARSPAMTFAGSVAASYAIAGLKEAELGSPAAAGGVGWGRGESDAGRASNRPEAGCKLDPEPTRTKGLGPRAAGVVAVPNGASGLEEEGDDG
jgi:hypothetical protein